jgi:hypothetical protein
MGLFTTLANTNCMKIKAILIRLILRIFGVKVSQDLSRCLLVEKRGTY